jgi:hypothetical protein
MLIKNAILNLSLKVSLDNILAATCILFIDEEIRYMTVIPTLVSVVLALSAIVIYGSWITITSNHDS